jgi:Na+-driven multidrug efflux pump
VEFPGGFLIRWPSRPKHWSGLRWVPVMLRTRSRWALRVTVLSTIAAGALAAILAVGAFVLPELFTGDASVLAAIGVPWWFLVAQLPVNGIVFALNGILLGAGDAAFIRTATIVSALVGFLPMIWLSLVFGWGLTGIWSGLTTFMLLRLIFMGARAFSGRWAVVGVG